MICDGIENCVQYIHNFDPEKSRNPFAYFTQIIHYAFLRRIQKEKKQQAIKQKAIMESGILNDMADTIDGTPSQGTNTYIEFLQQNMVPVNYKPRGSKKKEN